MSIVALKRKSAAIKNQSTGHRGFSINGTTRNQGYIGQTLQSRHLIHTPHKGAVAKGYGGCCGTYNDSLDIVPSELTCLEDSTVVKPSVLSYKGMMAKQMLGTTFNGVKPDSNHKGFDQSSHIERLKRKNLKKIEDFCPEPTDAEMIASNKSADACATLRTLKGARIFSKPHTLCSISKKVGPDTQEDHIFNLNKACLAIDVPYIATSIMRTPYF